MHTNDRTTQADNLAQETSIPGEISMGEQPLVGADEIPSSPEPAAPSIEKGTNAAATPAESRAEGLVLDRSPQEAPVLEILPRHNTSSGPSDHGNARADGSASTSIALNHEASSWFRESLDVSGPEINPLVEDWDMTVPDLGDVDLDDLSPALAELIPKRSASYVRRPYSGVSRHPDGDRMRFCFELDGGAFSILVQLAAATYSKQDDRPLVRLTVYHNRLNAQGHDHVRFFDHEIEINAGTKIPQGRWSTFYVSAADLRASANATSSVVTLEWTSGEALKLTSGFFERDIALRSPKQFRTIPESYAIVQPEQPPAAFPTSTIHSALRYAKPLLDFMRRKQIESAVIEARSGDNISAGSPGAFAVTATPGVSDALAVRNVNLPALTGALVALQDPIDLVVSERHQMFWDGQTVYGVERTRKSLSDARKKYDAVHWSTDILVPRPQLVATLRHLAGLVQTDTVELMFAGFGNGRLTIIAHGQDDRLAKKTIDAYLNQPYLPKSRFTVSRWAMVAALDASRSSNVVLRVSELGLEVDDSERPIIQKHLLCCYDTTNTSDTKAPKRP